MDIDPKLIAGMTDPNQDPKMYTLLPKGVNPANAHYIKMDLVQRADWGAAEPQEPPVPYIYPRVVLWYYDIGVNPCHNAEECVQRVRDIQKQHMDMGLPDIAYNFLVGGDGRVYEGRGYTNNPSKLGDKWAKYEGKSFDVAYIGRFTEDWPAYPDMQKAGNNLLQHAVLNQHVDYFFEFVEDVKPSEICLSECPYPAPDPEPGDPVVEFEGLGI